MNINRAIAVAKNLSICWIAFVALLGAAYLFERFDRGSPIHPTDPVPTPNLERSIDEAVDFLKLKEFCGYLARERDSDMAKQEQIRRKMDLAITGSLSLMGVLGIVTGVCCLYLWTFLRKQSSVHTSGL